jgi:hypothetical protein
MNIDRLILKEQNRFYNDQEKFKEHIKTSVDDLLRLAEIHCWNTISLILFLFCLIIVNLKQEMN